MAKVDIELGEMTADDSGGWLSNILAEDEAWSGATLWKLGSWAAAAIGSLVAAFFASHAVDGARRDQVASTEIMRQAQQIQWVAKEGQTETRRLAAAVDTLNADRDRLYARVTVLEQGLESVTGTVARHGPPASLVLSTASQPLALPPPAIAPAPVQPSTPSPTVALAEPAPAPQANHGPDRVAPGTSESADQGSAPGSHRDQLAATTVGAPPPPDPEPSRPIETLSDIKPAGAAPTTPAAKPAEATAAPPSPAPAAPAASAAAVPQEVAASRTEFGVDLGAAHSIEGLRALWRGLLKSDAERLGSLRPVVAIRERGNGYGMQLRLIAGPLGDAAAAARICAALGENHRPCETAVFDGQRLSLKADAPSLEASPSARTGEELRTAPKPAHKPAKLRRSTRHESAPAPAEPQAPAQAQTQGQAQGQPEPQSSQFSGLSAIFHR